MVRPGLLSGQHTLGMLSNDSQNVNKSSVFSAQGLVQSNIFLQTPSRLVPSTTHFSPKHKQLKLHGSVSICGKLICPRNSKQIQEIDSLKKGQTAQESMSIT